MLRSELLRVLEPLRRVVMWLTGQRELQARLDKIEQLVARLVIEQQASAAAQPTTAQASQQALMQALEQQHHSLAMRQDEAIHTGYRLSEKMDLALLSLTQLPQLLERPGSEVVSEEIDRLDGYLVYQLGGVRAELAAIRERLIPAQQGSGGEQPH